MNKVKFAEVEFSILFVAIPLKLSPIGISSTVMQYKAEYKSKIIVKLLQPGCCYNWVEWNMMILNIIENNISVQPFYLFFMHVNIT